MKTIYGNLLTYFENGEFDIIVHGCNCFCTMGAGIAKQIKQSYPDVYKKDLLTAKGDINKLGTYTYAEQKKQKYIINAYTQYKYFGEKNIDYSAIKNVFEKINTDFCGKIIGIPKIGAGLAGGDWEIIETIIDSIFNNDDGKNENNNKIVLVEYK
jgi:O-acetyl-ADP-ribose deacetylase (regulator of RNase III)